MIKLKNISKKYQHERNVLENITLSFEETGMTMIVGKSGVGKSTLLNILAGFDQSTTGEMIVDGKTVASFKEQDYDRYRNQYIGFVFQEFHLIEDYDVYENIVLATQLQGKKPTEKEIDSLLEKLQILSYKHQKVSKLSGGEKQRVAIARALIKHPKVILADEPTGNLDQKTGQEVMQLLKKISHDTLVIMVTHNQDYAKTYGDRVIELEDGKVISDSKKIPFEEEKCTYQAEKTKLPWQHAFHLGSKAFFHHKWRFLFSCLFLALACSFFISSYTILNYDVDRAHQHVLKQDQAALLQVKKVDYTDRNGTVFLPFQSEDFSNISKKVTVKGTVYQYMEKDRKVILKDLFHLNTYIQDDLFQDEQEKPRSIYEDPTILSEIITMTDFDFPNIVGRKPQNSNEIMISNYYADLLLQYGLYDDHDQQVFQPKTYEDIVTSSLSFHFGNYNKCQIVGIILYDTQKYDVLKTYYPKQTLPEEIQKLEQTFMKDKEEYYNKIYTLPTFIQNLKTKDLPKIDTENHQFILNLKNEDTKMMNVDVIHNDLEYYDGSKWQHISTLKPNEAILGLSILAEDSNTYDQEIRKLLGDQDFLTEEQEKTFVTSYLEKHSIKSKIGNLFSMKVYKNQHWYTPLQDEKKVQYSDLKIIGICFGRASYFSEEILSEYKGTNTPIVGLIPDKKQANEADLFQSFPYHSEYIIYSEYSDMLLVTNRVLYSLRNFICVLTFTFGIFASLLLINFTSTSIRDRKKDIGILKAMGCHRGDIIKIFIIEAIGLAIGTYLCTELIITGLFHFLNGWINNPGLFSNSMRLSSELFLFLLLFVFAIVYCTSSRIFKKNLVKVIQNG